MTHFWPCSICGMNVFKDEYSYMVHNNIWEMVGYDCYFLCIGCLENRLGRPLIWLDFVWNLPINSDFFWDRSDRLKRARLRNVRAINPPTGERSEHEY